MCACSLCTVCVTLCGTSPDLPLKEITAVQQTKQIPTHQPIITAPSRPLLALMGSSKTPLLRETGRGLGHVGLDRHTGRLNLGVTLDLKWSVSEFSLGKTVNPTCDWR